MTILIVPADQALVCLTTGRELNTAVAIDWRSVQIRAIDDAERNAQRKGIAYPNRVVFRPDRADKVFTSAKLALLS